MTTIDLADRLELTELDKDEIRVSSHNRFVPDDQRNLAYQAAKLLKQDSVFKRRIDCHHKSNSRRSRFSWR